MKLDRIEISNFKGLREVVFEPATFTCLVGENNAGKSTVLQAVTASLNRPKRLDLAYYYDETTSVGFKLQFSEITDRDLDRLDERHRSKMAACINDGTFMLVLRYPPERDLETSTVLPTPREPKYRDDAISGAFRGKRGNAVRQALEENYPEFVDGSPDELNITQANEYVARRVSELPAEQFEPTEQPLPTGIPAAISNLLPEPIYIPAVKDLRDDLKTSQSTPFGRLLGLLLEDMEPDLGQINQTFAELERLLNRVPTEDGEVDERHDRVRDLEGRVEGYLQEHFPHVSLKLAIPPPDLKVVLNNAKILVDDGSEDLIDNKGDGIRRSLTFALLRSYVSLLAENREALAQANDEAGDQALPRPLLFMFEEPELFLHPRSQRVLFSALATISETHQVVVTTHSPLFFEPGVTAAFVRVAKQAAEPKPIGELYPVNFVLDPEKAEVFRLTIFENAEAAFFSKAVVLFEGESDDAFCRHVAKMLDPSWDFEHANIALVKVSGKGNFARFRAFFESFGLKVLVVADLDAFFEGFQHLGAPAAAGEMRGDAIAAVDARAAELGVKPEPATRQIKDKLKSQTWRQRYESARQVIRNAQGGAAISPADLDTLDGLFTWEQDVARVNVCRDDADAQTHLSPVLDRLRASGVIILSKGAIEDYYPDGAPKNGQKPARALEACKLVQNREDALALSVPLAPTRQPELFEVFQALFQQAG